MKLKTLAAYFAAVTIVGMLAIAVVVPALVAGKVTELASPAPVIATR